MTVPEGWTSIKFRNTEELIQGISRLGLERVRARIEAFENGDLAAGQYLVKMFSLGKMSSPEAEELLVAWMRERAQEAASGEPGSLLKTRKPAGRPRAKRKPPGWRDVEAEDLALLEEVREELSGMSLEPESRLPEFLAAALDAVVEKHEQEFTSRKTLRRKLTEFQCRRLLEELDERRKREGRETPTVS